LTRLNKEDSFDGIIEVDFELRAANEGIFLDYAGKELHRVCVNGTVLDNSKQFSDIWDT